MKRDMSQPEPLSSPECDLRGLEWMPLQTADLLDSDLFLLSTGEEFKAAIALICKSWRQVPAGSLPNDDNALAQLSMARDWTSVRTMALRNWQLCADGRLYHPIVAAKAMEALPHREQFVEKKTAEAERKQRERKDRKDLFARLRAAGIVLPYDTKTAELRLKVAGLAVVDKSADNQTSHADSRDDQSRGNRDLSRLGHDTTPPDPTGIPLSQTDSSGVPPAGGDDQPPGDGGNPFELNGNHGEGEAAGAPVKLPPCPHMEILKLWAEVLPQLPQHDPEEWNDARRAHLQRRWKEKAALKKWPDQQAGLTYFRRLFTWIGTSQFLTGRAESRDKSRKPFVIELEWLIRPANWSKVLEGKYHTE